MIRAAVITFAVGAILIIGLALWRANDPSDDIFVLPECEYGVSTTTGEPC